MRPIHSTSNPAGFYNDAQAPLLAALDHVAVSLQHVYHFSPANDLSVQLPHDYDVTLAHALHDFVNPIIVLFLSYWDISYVSSFK